MKYFEHQVIQIRRNAIGTLFKSMNAEKSGWELVGSIEHTGNDTVGFLFKREVVEHDPLMDVAGTSRFPHSSSSTPIKDSQ